MKVFVIQLLAVVALAVGGCGDGAGAGPGGGDGVDGGGAGPDGRPVPDAKSPSGDPGDDCDVLRATIRDFRDEHPDFETFTRDEVYPGIVESELGDDDKPVYAHPGPTPHTTGPDEFAQWYRDVPGVNEPVPVELDLTEEGQGVYVFDDQEFFPVDGAGFGSEGRPHNFHFTTEIHTVFEYRGGEQFTFRGDDDLWLFVNGRLAIDLGGLHQARTATVDMDQMAGALGIEVGQRYPMDIFHAERHTTASRFRIETTIDCFIVP